MGQNSIDEMRSCVRHAATAAGTAETAAFARERHKPIIVTVITVDAQEAIGIDPAFQELTHFSFYEPWW
jgi:hypothetical protein